MANRERKNELKIYLSDDEQYILEQKLKASGMKSKSAFLRRQILYGFVYDIDYFELREYNSALGKIGNNLNPIAKQTHERHRKRLCCRRKGSKRTDETGVGYSKNHALKTATPETVNCIYIPSRAIATFLYKSAKVNLQYNLKADKFRTIKKDVSQ